MCHRRLVHLHKDHLNLINRQNGHGVAFDSYLRTVTSVGREHSPAAALQTSQARPHLSTLSARVRGRNGSVRRTGRGGLRVYQQGHMLLCKPIPEDSCPGESHRTNHCLSLYLHLCFGRTGTGTGGNATSYYSSYDITRVWPSRTSATAPLSAQHMSSPRTTCKTLFGEEDQ